MSDYLMHEPILDISQKTFFETLDAFTGHQLQTKSCQMHKTQSFKPKGDTIALVEFSGAVNGAVGFFPPMQTLSENVSMPRVLKRTRSKKEKSNQL